MKCAICKEKVQTTFLEKIIGTYVNKKPVCRNCQKKLTTEEMKKQI